jgi:hypothetical protein
MRFHTAVSRASTARSERKDTEICQPTTMREVENLEALFSGLGPDVADGA